MMNKLKVIFVFIAAIFLTNCNQAQQSSKHSPEKKASPVVQKGEPIKKVEKSAQQWKQELNEMEYYVLREQGTERAFTGDLWDYKGKATYTCRGCGLSLFESDTKFDSGTGWPSFYQPPNTTCIEEDVDNSMGMRRVEVHCARCGGHLGHVFDDGPKPTGLRYCINSVSLDVVKK